MNKQMVGFEALSSSQVLLPGWPDFPIEPFQYVFEHSNELLRMLIILSSEAIAFRNSF